MKNPLVQIALTALGVFGLLRWLASSDLGFLVVVAITALAAFTAVLLYQMRFDPARAEALYKIGWLKPIVGMLCKLGGLQPPVAGSANAAGALSGVSGSDSGNKSSSPAGASGGKPKGKQPPPEILLQKSEDFNIAKNSICSVVRGHDSACICVFDYLERNVVLRARQAPGAILPPLGAFLLIGGPGIGKRFLATAVSQLLYAGKGLCRIDLKDFPGEDGIQKALAISATESGSVITAVRSRPYQVILFENIEAADRKGIELLASVLSGGALRDASSGTNISFQNCVFFLTTTKSVPLLQAIRNKQLPQQKFLAEVRDALGTDTQVNEPLLARLGEVIVLDNPTSIVQAEVVALLIQRECKRFDVRLDYVEPAILAEEVARITPSHGFEPVPGRVTALLREPLYLASKNNSKRLVLDIQPADVFPQNQTASMSSQVAASPAAQ